MYKFIDTIESSEGVSLPSEALQINGEYIENQIEGYRTLTVEGREALSPEIESFDTGIRDGSTISGKRYPARTIRVTYQLIAATNEDFRAAYNKLASILNVQDAQLIFNDEQDKFFTGTPSRIGEVEPGKNAVIGEFELFCADPFKYSVMEYEAEPDIDSNSILIDYAGTYKSYPKLEAHLYKEDEVSEDGETVTELTGQGDCGYVAFFNEDKKIIQIGDPEEADGETAYEASQTLCFHDFGDLNTSWGAAARSQWAVNKGTTSSAAVEQVGSFQMSPSYYRTPQYATTRTQNVLRIVSEAEAPDVVYNITITGRRSSETKVKLNVTVAANLGNYSSYFLKGFSVRAHVYIGGAWKSFILKTLVDEWRGTTVHKKSFDVEVNVSATAGSVRGIKFKATRDDSKGGKTGIINETECDEFFIDPYTIQTVADYYFTVSDYGSGNNWHGPSITRAIPADASGDVGAANFALYYGHRMSVGLSEKASNELGAFQVLLVDANKKVVAGVNIYKGTTGKTAKLRFYINGAVKETIDFSLPIIKYNYDDKYIYSTITKMGQSVTFDIGGVKRTYKDSAITEAVVTDITFTLSKFGTKPALTYNGLTVFKFVKHNCNTWRNIPNKLSANDVVEADCKSGEIFLNGIPAARYGALGNDWEGFCLKPGLNQIGFSYSDWVIPEYAPGFKVKYREVFL